MSDLEFRFDLQRFADAPTGTPGGEPSGTPAPGDGNQTPGQSGGSGEGGKVTFTPEQQAELERILGDRVKRAEASGAKKALEAKARELGFESAQALEDTLRAYKEAQEKQKTAEQKAAEEAAKLRNLQAQVKTKLLRAEVYSQAVQAGADPELTWAYLQSSGDLTDADPESPEFSETVKAAVQEAIKAKPVLKVQQGGNVGSTGGNPSRGGPQPDDAVERAKAEASKRNAGRHATAGFDPWNPSSGQQDVEKIAQTVATAVAAALQGLQLSKG